jgi:hypothetical protein
VVPISLAGAPSEQVAPLATAAGTPGAQGAAAAGSFLFRGPEVLYLSHTALSGVAGAASGVPPLAPAAPVATTTGPATVATAPPGAPTPAPAVPHPGAPVGAAVPLTPGVPQPIATLWPDLPDSFKLGVRGAADVDGVLYLFKGGRYVRADGSVPPADLNGVAGWPQTPAWKDGVVDLVGSGRGDGRVLLVRGGEYLEVDLARPAPGVVAGPAPLGAAFGGAFLAALQAPGGADAVLFGGATAAHGGPWVFQGPAVAGFDSAGAGGVRQWRSYVAHHFSPLWPATWNPVLAQAPSGRVGDLWAATPEGAILHHDGGGWTQTEGLATSVAAGADGSAYCVGVDLAQHNLYRWDEGSGSWGTVLQEAPTLVQVAVGTADQVLVRDAGNAVHQLQGTQLRAVPAMGAAVHIAANADGTVWGCDGIQPAAFRLIPEATAPPDALAAAGAVHKVASTGFGEAYLLVGEGAGAQPYRYDSPYVFKTSRPYPLSDNGIETGLGNLYVTVTDGAPGGPGGTSYVVALDVHTGQEVSRSGASPPETVYTKPVFDPLHEVVIVSPYAPGTAAGSPQLLGLDARDLTRVRWTISTEGGVAIAGPPTLQGTRLSFTDDRATVCMYDTGEAPDGTPVHRWTYALPVIPVGEYRLPQPVVSGDRVYAAWWTYDTSNQQQRLYLVTLDAATGAGPAGGPAAFTAIDAATASGRTFWFGILGGYTPTLAQVADGNQTRAVLFVNGGNTVWRIDVGAPNPARSYHLTGNQSLVTSGLAYGAGGLWFGDGAGTFYGLDDAMQPLPPTPLPLGGTAGDGAQIATTPVVYEGAPGGPVVFLGVFRPDRPAGLLAYDPATGHTVATATGRTSLTALSPAVADGVLYAGGGWSGDGTGTGVVAQVLGIRVDEAVQGLRDFVAESALLQDFDAAPAGQAQPANPQGTARYQTHLTVLDDARAPRPRTTVKVWADAPTALLINGTAFRVGPGDAQFAAAQTGPDGVVTIVSGAVAGTGAGAAPVSAAADVAAVPLRVWAPFMDPYERLVVFPDREFHNRLATTHATPAGQSGADDPTRINLSTAQSYGPLQRGGAPSGPSLFTPGERQQQPPQPQQVAQAIQTMTTATAGFPAGGASATAGRAASRGGAGAGAAWVRRETDTPGAAGRYLAYDDLPGARYSPVNTPSPRPVAVVQPAGLTYSGDDAGAAPPAYRPLTPAAAAAAIDALQGTPWEQSPQAPPHIRAAALAGARRGALGAGVGSWWSDFWDWLKGAAARITHFIVSVAEEVYVGIRYVVGTIVYVFKQVVHAVEEVAHAIGALFVALAKAIEKVLEALSVLFHFGEIVKTHTLIKNELLNRINGVPGNPAYPGLAAVVKGTVVPKVDGAFKDAAAGAAGALNALADRIGGAAPVGGMRGGGSTAHTTFSVGPRSGGAPSSLAVQGTWGLHKVTSGARAGAGSTSAGVRAAPGVRPGASAPAGALAAFYKGFAADVGAGGTLAGQWQTVRAGFEALHSGGDAGDFLKRGLAELLRALALLVDGILVVANAFVDGLLGLIDDLVALLFDAQSGLLTRELDIPVLSWLYEQLFGAPLTVLDVLMLVVAIPVTVIWRIVEGQWPSQSFGAAGATGGLGAGASGLVSLLSEADAVFSIALGFFAAGVDVWGLEAPPGVAWLSRLALGCSVVISGLSIPQLTAAAPSVYDWLDWGLSLAVGSVNALGVVTVEDPLSSAGLTALGSFLVAFLSTAQLCAFVAQFMNAPPPDALGDAALGLSLATAVPGIVNFVKLAGLPASAVVALVDVAMGFVAATVQLLLELESRP